MSDNLCVFRVMRRTWECTMPSSRTRPLGRRCWLPEFSRFVSDVFACRALFSEVDQLDKILDTEDAMRQTLPAFAASASFAARLPEAATPAEIAPKQSQPWR